MPWSCFITVPPEITGQVPHRSTSEEELTGAEKRMVAGKEMLRGQREEKKMEREGERGHEKGKIKEKVVKRCVLVLS